MIVADMGYSSLCCPIGMHTLARGSSKGKSRRTVCTLSRHTICCNDCRFVVAVVA